MHCRFRNQKTSPVFPADLLELQHRRKVQLMREMCCLSSFLAQIDYNFFPDLDFPTVVFSITTQGQSQRQHTFDLLTSLISGTDANIDFALFTIVNNVHYIITSGDLLFVLINFLSLPGKSKTIYSLSGLVPQPTK